MKDIVVAGSLNVDIVVTVDKLPRSGETKHGLSIQRFSGGKGANQAVALARLGRSVSMVGGVGEDEGGEILEQGLIENGVDTTCLARSETEPTGQAVIIVDQEGNNQIVVLSGANGCVDRELIDRSEPTLRNARFILAQFEIPIATVMYLIDFAGKHQIPVVINPSPFQPIEEGVLSKIDYLVLNEVEASLMLGSEVTSVSQAKEAACAILERGVKHIIVTLGDRGAVICEAPDSAEHIPDFAVEAVDTTACGDAFLAGLLHGLLEGWSLREAAVFGNAVGALTATRPGAQASLPYLVEVDRFRQR